MSHSQIDRLAAALEDTGVVVTGIRQGQWDLSTPCTQWSVGDVVTHLIAGQHLFARALRGNEPPTSSTLTGLHPDQRTAAYRQSTDALLAAFRLPGALERIVHVPFGAVPGIVALHLRTVEALVHGWDLARATGQQAAVDEEVAESELQFTKTRLADVPAGRSPFGPPRPVAHDAPALDRLAACLGRDVSYGTG